jgi:hypothetical protein
VDGICVYRYRRAEVVARALAGLPEARWLLWALDEVHSSLAAVTVGTGAGTRVELLNRLTKMVDSLGAERYLLMIDDDVDIAAGGLRRFVKTAAILGLDLAQPAHCPKSVVSWQFTLARGLCLARLTTFVECGPVVLFSPRGRDVLLPYPEHLRMGWGVEVGFAGLAEQHKLRLGIVDAVRMRHLSSVANAYSFKEEYDLSRAELARGGLSSYEDIQVVLRRWGMFQRLS